MNRRKINEQRRPVAENTAKLADPGAGGRRPINRGLERRARSAHADAFRSDDRRRIERATSLPLGALPCLSRRA